MKKPGRQIYDEAATSEIQRLSWSISAGSHASSAFTPLIRLSRSHSENRQAFEIQCPSYQQRFLPDVGQGVAHMMAFVKLRFCSYLHDTILRGHSTPHEAEDYYSR
jgi:hypothetical protein